MIAAEMIRFLIDGYNFLNASGIDTQDQIFHGGTSLERNRLALLDFLVGHLTPEELAATVVVFDGHYSRRSNTEQFTYHGLTVRFAARYPDADSLLEEMIREHTSPRRLTVISSDHRIQRAAHRRRARFIDSDIWYRKLCARHSRRMQTTQQVQVASDKESIELSPEDLESWLQEFSAASKMSDGGASASSEAIRAKDQDSRNNLQPPPHGRQDDVRDPGNESFDVNMIRGSVEQWAERLGLSPEELNRPLDSLEDDQKPPKKARRRKK